METYCLNSYHAVMLLLFKQYIYHIPLNTSSQRDKWYDISDYITTK